jgi:hypothetical protein
MRRIAFMMILIAVCADAKAFDKRANMLNYGLSLIREELYYKAPALTSTMPSGRLLKTLSGTKVSHWLWSAPRD